MTQTAQELRFSHDAQGRIVFNGQPYLYLSAGSLPEGQRRAEQKAAWLNECLDAALEAQLTETRELLARTTEMKETWKKGFMMKQDETVTVIQSRRRLVGLVRGYQRELSNADEFIDDVESARDTARAEALKAKIALRLLLGSHDCLAPDGTAEIPEEISACFDIGLDEAQMVINALAATDTAR